MRYLSIDNALAVSGWAIFEDKQLIDHGVFKTSATDSLGKRLSDISCKVCNLIEDNDINFIFFEDCQQQSNRNVQTFHKLSMVKGIIMFTCFQETKECECLSPSSWRSVLKDKFNFKFGRARAEQKKKAKEFVREHFNIEATEDECDAICLGYAGILKKSVSMSAF